MIFVLAAVLVLPVPTLAATRHNRTGKAKTTVPSTVVAGSALEPYEAARLLFAASDFEGALVKFRSAYEISSDPRLLWNMAACEMNLRHYLEVRRLTRLYLSEGIKAGVVDASDKRSADELLASLPAVIGSVILEIQPPDTRIGVDGVELGVAPLTAPVELDVGQHQLVFSRPGYRSIELKREIKGGPEVQVVKVTLSPEVAVLKVKTNVEGAVISIDGKVKGSTAWQGELTPGNRLISVSASGYQPFNIDINLSDNDHRDVTVALERRPGQSNAVAWILAGSAVAIGAGVGAFFLLREREAPLETGNVGPGIVYLLRSGGSP